MLILIRRNCLKSGHRSIPFHQNFNVNLFNLFQMVNCLEALPIRQVSCGGSHTVIVTISGAVYAWGRNSRGQLGVGDKQVGGIKLKFALMGEIN